MVDLHIDPAALNNYYAIAGAAKSATDECSVRLFPKFGEADGFRELIRLAPGFYIILGDILCRREAYVSMKSDSSLKFHYRLEGSSAFDLSDDKDNEVKNHTLGLLLHPEGLLKQEHYRAGEHERSVTLICEAPFLRSRLLNVSNLPEALRRFILNGDATLYRDNLPMSLDISAAASSVLSCSLSGMLRRIFIEGKALELLSLSLQACIDVSSSENRPEHGMSKRDIERTHRVRNLLQENYANPPTISQLAREIGVNEAKLMHDYKQIFGQTIFVFAQSVRMDVAKEMLEHGDKSLTEIALEIGYDYSSNFATAFKRHFGVTPSAARAAFRNS